MQEIRKACSALDRYVEASKPVDLETGAQITTLQVMFIETGVIGSGTNFLLHWKMPLDPASVTTFEFARSETCNGAFRILGRSEN